MEFKKINVLVMDGGGKQTLAMVRGLKEIGCHVTVLCSSKLDACYVSNKPDRKIINACIVDRDNNTADFILKLLKTGKYDVLMPIGELSTNFVTDNEAKFTKYAKIACAPRETYIKAFNKQTTFDKAIELGIPCPYTRHSSQDIEDYLSKATFPIIIKPRQGLGSIGFHKFETEKEFRDRLDSGTFNVDEFVVQEFIDFDKRVGTNLFVDQKGNICTAYAVDVLRWFPIDAGAGVLMQTVDAHDALSYAGQLLQGLGWKGFANVAFMLDKKTNGPKLLEINGRIPASIKISYMCGCNIARQLLEMIYDEDVIQYKENKRFGIYCRHLDTDIAWLLKSKDRFRTKPSWFSWKDTEEVLYSKDDKKPFFAHMIQRIFRYRYIMDKKKH